MARHPNHGYSLTELMIALLLSSFLIMGLLKIFGSSRRSYDTQTGNYNMQQSGQFALQFIAREIRQSGFVYKPWADERLAGVSEDSLDTGSSGDRLALQYQSDRNCYGSKNSPAGDGEVPFYLKQLRFSLRASRQQLAWWCAYAATGAELVVQVNNQTLVDRIDSFQVLYGTDTDADGNPDQWANAGNWVSSEGVAVIALAILVQDEIAAPEQESESYTLLDYDTGLLPGGFRREVLQSTVALRNYRS
jgi:type IV pilus assembly protein PilW